MTHSDGSNSAPDPCLSVRPWFSLRGLAQPFLMVDGDYTNAIIKCPHCARAEREARG